MKRVLITGAQGFVGRYLVAHWLNSDPQVEILGIGRSPLLADTFTHNVHYGNKELPAPLPNELSIGKTSRYKYGPIDIRNKAELSQTLRDFRPQIVIHLASFLHGHSFDHYFDTNIIGTRNLVEIAAQVKPTPRVVLGSSGAVYGAAPESHLPLRETEVCTPFDDYGKSKLTSEYMSRIIASFYNVSTVWVRLFNLVGPGQQEIHVCGRLASEVASIMLGLSSPSIHTKSLRATRDFIDVRDVAVGLELLARVGLSGEIYNLASGEETPITTVLEDFLKIARLPHVQIKHVEEPDTQVSRHFASSERLRTLGFARQYSLKDSLADLLSYYLHDVRAKCRNATSIATST